MPPLRYAGHNVITEDQRERLERVVGPIQLYVPDNNGLFSTFSIFQEINQNAGRLPMERQAPGIGRQATAEGRQVIGSQRRRSNSDSDYDLAQRPRARRRGRRRQPMIDLPVEQQPAFL
jgi:hypothetical protein